MQGKHGISIQPTSPQSPFLILLEHGRKKQKKTHLRGKAHRATPYWQLFWCHEAIRGPAK